MNIRRSFFVLLVVLAGTFCAQAAQAQPGGFAAVTPERVAELESMHQQAIDSLLKNDFQGAIRTYSDILLLEPDDEIAYTGLGQIYLLLGQYKKAHEAFENALEINPDNQVAILGIQRIMDPDGTEGMVSRHEILAEERFPPAPVKMASVERLLIDSVPAARMAERRSALKAKKSDPSSNVKKVSPGSVRRLGRTGFLHAQRVQMALKTSGFYAGPVNGLIGASVKDSLRKFQKDFGLRANGRMTAATWSRLSEYLSTR